MATPATIVRCYMRESHGSEEVIYIEDHPVVDGKITPTRQRIIWFETLYPPFNTAE